MPMMLLTFFAAVQIHRHALLIGINDYTASHIAAVPRRKPAARSDFPDLHGAVNDAAGMRDMLIARSGFTPDEITTLTDQAASRDAILQAIRSQLIDDVKSGDVVFFYFAGHGSQKRNSKSDEPDKLDETIVSADSRLGADDIRDKELRRLFNAALDRGARLTVMIDACYSGSGARGLPTGLRPRALAPDLRDVADGGPYGPRPENRGALVISATQDFAMASETPNHQHGAFTWAWMRSLRAAAAEEPAIETFLRAQALLRGETPFQEPVIAGTDAARRTPFLGGAPGARRAAVALQRIRSDGTAVIEGGWANGLNVGTELRPSESSSGPRLVITSIDGLVRSTARVFGGHDRIAPGALLTVTSWGAPPPAQLTVSIPRTNASASDIRAIAAAVQRAARKRGLKWIGDPVVSTPEYVLRWHADGWELLHDAGVTRVASPIDAVAAIERGSSLFFQAPVPAELADAIEFRGNAIVSADRPQYVLAGRLHRGNLEYAWVRPGVSKADRRKTPLPLRSTWLTYAPDDAEALEYRALALHKILAWNELESPPHSRWPYHLVLPQRLEGQQTYPLVMRNAGGRAAKRFVYVFAIDSYGQSTLLFPPSGSIENRLPIGEIAPGEVALGRIRVTPPYGVDTYFLLTTAEPLVDPWVLQWDGVTRSPASILAPVEWSIERVVVESVPPRRHKVRTAVSH